MNFDWKTWCRFCGNAQNNVKFESTIDIEFHFEISDQHPKICQQCSVSLKEFEDFLSKTEKSNVLFKELTNLKLIDSSKINKIREIFGFDLLKVEAELSGKCTTDLPDLKIKEELDLKELQKNVQDVNDKTLRVQKKVKTEPSMAKKRTKKSRNSNPDNLKRSREEIEKRKLIHKIIRTKCHLCKTHCASMSELIKHCRTEHDCRPQVPCICGFILDHADSYFRHSKRCCADLMAPYKCDLCKNSYASRNGIRNHMVAKHILATATKNICKICGKEFKYPFILSVHEKVHLPPEIRKIFECSQCDKKFSSKSLLKTHMYTHGKMEKCFTCHICAKTFTYVNSLKTHIESHNTTLNYECDVCSRKFKSKSLLQSHQVIHKKEKTHFCEICNRAFLRPHQKTIHMISHTDQRPHACPAPNCDLTFKRKGELEVHHNRVHLGKQRYICKFCGKDFYYTKDRYQHIKEQHPKEFVEFEEKYKLVGKRK